MFLRMTKTSGGITSRVLLNADSVTMVEEMPDTFSMGHSFVETIHGCLSVMETLDEIAAMLPIAGEDLIPIG